MSVSNYLNLLKRDRMNWVPVILTVFVIVYVVTVVRVLVAEEDESNSSLIMSAIVIGLMIITYVIFGVVRTANRIWQLDKQEAEIKALFSKYVNSRDLLHRIDNQTREEVGSWIHGTLQPKLAKLARDIRNAKDGDFEMLAERVDEINEEDVRAYSHVLFPPALLISLEVGLETLLENRADLVLDPRFTSAANLGFSVLTLQPSSESGEQPIRFNVGRDLGYAIYRIIEEAVANAEKKATTTKILVTVSYASEILSISVHDNGHPIAPGFQAGLGMTVIEAFTEKYEGTMSLKNVDGGVELLAQIPYIPVTVSEKLVSKFGELA
jgi:signal transduction histidine kinase